MTGCSILVAMLVFRRNFRRLEHIVVSGGAVVVAYYFQDALIEQRRMMIYGLGIEREDDPDFGCLRVSLRQRDRRIEIGRDLSPFERAHLSDRLVSALRDAGIPPKMRHINHAPFFPTDPNLAKSV